MVEAGCRDDERDMAVLGVVAAVFGDLAGLVGIDDAVLHESDEVGDAGAVRCRVQERAAAIRN